MQYTQVQKTNIYHHHKLHTNRKLLLLKYADKIEN